MLLRARTDYESALSPIVVGTGATIYTLELSFVGLTECQIEDWNANRAGRIALCLVSGAINKRGETGRDRVGRDTGYRTLFCDGAKFCE